jgi:DDE superfamily endonuclease
VHHAKLFGRCEHATGIESFGRLVDQVMSQQPYRDARRVFWILDNGSSHRGAPCVRRLQAAYPNLVPVHGPVHASWLNQIEIYFSIVQRKALTPNDFRSLEEVEQRLLGFQSHYEGIAKPFQWRFTRADLATLLAHFDHMPVPNRMPARRSNCVSPRFAVVPTVPGLARTAKDSRTDRV